MRINFQRILIIVFVVFLTGLMAVFLFHPAKKFSLGLDISGGTLLVYEADLFGIKPDDYSSAMAGLRDVVERRINYSGIKEPRVQINRTGEKWRLIVEIAGIKDIKEAIKMIGETPYLEFKEPFSDEENAAIRQATEEQKIKNPDINENLEGQMFFKSTPLTGRYLKRAEVVFDPNTSLPAVSIQFDEEGTKIFAELTKRNLNKPLAIYLDNIIISAPTVKEVIGSGRAQISGDFNLAEAKKLSERLNQGALPVPIVLISQQTIGAILGEESLAKILRAGVFGFLAVIIFMIAVYRLEGLIASFALLVYLIFTLFIFKALPVTLTLAGITGFLLSIGMTVDANVLIFEHGKAEKKNGRSTKIALEEGFLRSWPAIRDSNAATVISVVILYYFSASMIRGFALTLGIGTMAGIITSIYLVRLMVGTFYKN